MQSAEKANICSHESHAEPCSLLVEKEAQGVGESVVFILDGKSHTIVVGHIEHGLVGHLACMLVRCDAH